ncbi:MAG: terminase gpA endonuclease subunit, partial [Microvirgula sp.]
YGWVRSRRRRYPGIEIMAIKGAKAAGAEIFSRPRPSLDTDYRNSKVSKYGLRVFMVGTAKAKVLLIGPKGRLTLDGYGPGRFHFSRHVRSDYCEQLLAERKVPKRGKAGYSDEMVWQKVPGARNEALDTEVYALHAARAVKVHLKSDADWDRIDQSLRQSPLFDEPVATAPVTDEPPDPEDNDDDFEPLEAGSMLED